MEREPLQETLGLNDPDCTWVRNRQQFARLVKQHEAKGWTYLDLPKHEYFFSEQPIEIEYGQHKFKCEKLELPLESTFTAWKMNYLVGLNINPPSAILPICPTN